MRSWSPSAPVCGLGCRSSGRRWPPGFQRKRSIFGAVQGGKRSNTRTEVRTRRCLLRFGLRYQVEAALAAYILPLVEGVSDAAKGKGKGDWRAAATLLQGRFPHEFSERVAVAKSQRVEVKGSIEHTHSYLRLEAMSDTELQAELESVHWAMRSEMLYGDELGDVIAYLEDKLSLMRHHHERKTAYIPQRDELAPGARAPHRSRL